MTAAKENIETVDASAASNAPQLPPRHAERKNGFIEYLFNDEGVFVMIQPPVNGGKPVLADQLKTNLIEHGFNHLLDEESLRAIYRSRETPFKVSGLLLDVEKKDGRLKLDVSKDGMEALLTITPPWGGKTVAFEDVKTEMENQKIIFGVDEEAIRTALRESIADSPRVAAKGIPPVPGNDADMRYFFERDIKATPKELENGRVDYRELNLVISVTKGTVLAEKIPATDGTQGKDVFGKETPAKRGRDFIPHVGKGVERSEDGMRLIASVDGCPVVTGKQLKVLPVYEVKGDVDFTTGNVYFMGSVVIRGSVRSGFKVTASGNVEIFQGVEDARIEAEGKILVKRGISGQGKAFLKSSEDIMAKFIQRAEIRTKENVHAGACFHSTVSAGKKVIVGGKRGLIVGGLIRAGLEVNARTVGSPYATPTEIEVGIDPQLREDSKNISNQLTADTENLSSVEKALKHIEATTQSGKQLPQYKAVLYQRLRQAKQQLEERLKELKEKRSSVKEQIGAESKGVLRAKDVLHPGVKISFKQTSRIITDEKKNICLYETEGEMKEGVA